MPAVSHHQVPDEAARQLQREMASASTTIRFRALRYSQLLGAGRRFLHAVSLLQQLEELLHWDSRVRRPPEGENLPQQHSERPPAAAGGAGARYRKGFGPTRHLQTRKQTADSHVALVRVDAVEQGLRCHPLHGETTLQNMTTSALHSMTPHIIP